MTSTLKMRQTRFFRKDACIGIDLQGQTPVAIRARRTRQGLRYAPVTPPGSDTASEHGYRHELTAACLSSRESLTRWLEAPLASPSKARRIFPSLLDIQLPFAIEDCVYAFLHPEKTPNRHVRALAVAARRQDAEKALARMQACGWDPHGLDHEGLALWTQSLREIPPDPPANAGRRAILYLGADRWTLVLGQGARFLGSHAMRTGDEAQLLRFLKAEWGDARADADPKANADKTRLLWVWTGPGATSDDTATDLQQRMAANWPGASAIHEKPDAFLARALATRALIPGPYRCNLRSGPLTHPDIRKQARKRAAAPAWICLAAGAALIAANIAVHTLVRHRESETEQRFSELRDTLLGYSLPVTGEDALREVRTALDKIKQDEQPFAKFLTTPSPLERMLALVRYCAENDMHLETAEIGDEHIVLRGSAPNWPLGEALANVVESSGFPVTLKRQSARDDGRIPWTIASRTSP